METSKTQMEEEQLSKSISVDQTQKLCYLFSCIKVFPFFRNIASVLFLFELYFEPSNFFFLISYTQDYRVEGVSILAMFSFFIFMFVMEVRFLKYNKVFYKS